MKYKGKLKSLEEIVNSFNVQDIHTTFLKFVINNQDKIIEVRRLNDDSDKKFVVNDRFCFLKENFSELEEIKENEVWKPEFNEEFFYISKDGRICKGVYDNRLDDKFIKSFNCFKTKEQAEQVEKAQKLLRTQMAWKFQNDDVENCKYSILKDEYGKNETSFSLSITFLNNVKFSTQEKAEKCIEFLKKEGLI